MTKYIEMLFAQQDNCNEQRQTGCGDCPEVCGCQLLKDIAHVYDAMMEEVRYE